MNVLKYIVTYKPNGLYITTYHNMYYIIGRSILIGLIFYTLFSKGGLNMAYDKSKTARSLPAAGTAAPDPIVALYVRVSTGYQVDKDSLPFQKKELKNYCKHVLHLENIEIFEDAGKSGKNTNRPAFERMMKKVRSGAVSHVVVYKIDRISRNLVDFSLMYDDFKYNRVTFISLNEQFDTSSAIGEAVLKIILIFAELERKLTSERVKDVMIGRAQSGQWNGARVPFAWDWDEETKFPKHSEAEAVFGRLIYDLYEETGSSCKVRDYLNDHDIPTKRGGEWTSKTVADFIRNPMNKGDYRYNYRESARGRKKPDEEVVYIEGVFPPLVDPAQWDRCNKTMDANAAAKRNQGFSHRRKHIHIFAGLLVCADCGSYFQAIKKDRPRDNGFTPSLYRCGSRYRKRSCNSVGASDVVIGPFVFNFVSNLVKVSGSRSKYKTPEELETALLSGPDFKDLYGIEQTSLETIFAALLGRVASGGASYIPAPPASVDRFGSSEIEKAEKEKAQIERALERLKKLYLFDDEGMTEKEYLTTKGELSERLVKLSNMIADAEQSAFDNEYGEIAFVNSASSFLVSYKIQSGERIVYNDFAAAVDDQVLHDFVLLIIDRIVIQNGRPASIVFKNGLEVKFIYK